MIRIPVGVSRDTLPECILLTNEVPTGEPVPPAGALRAEKGFNSPYYAFSRVMPEHLKRCMTSEAFERVIGTLNEAIRTRVDQRARETIESFNEAFRAAGMGNIITVAGADAGLPQPPPPQPGPHAAGHAGGHDSISGTGNGLGPGGQPAHGGVGGQGGALTPNLKRGGVVGCVPLLPMLVAGGVLGMASFVAGLGTGTAALTWIGALLLAPTLGVYHWHKWKSAQQPAYTPLAGAGASGARDGMPGVGGTPELPDANTIIANTHRSINEGFERAQRARERQLQLRAEFGAQIRDALQCAALDAPGTYWSAHDQLAAVVRTRTGAPPHSISHSVTCRVSWPYILVSTAGDAHEDPLLNAPSLSMSWPHEQQHHPAPVAPASHSAAQGISSMQPGAGLPGYSLPSAPSTGV